MGFSGVIFDFNGTLFWDTELHNRAWDGFLEKHGKNLTFVEKAEKIHGKNNRDILKGIFTEPISEEQGLCFALEKEEIYQRLCLEAGTGFAPGAEDFLHFLSDTGVAFTIATSSGKENVDFYFNNTRLGNWFGRDEIVYNDGSIKNGKPAPDIFLRAMQKIGKKPGEVLIFEDSLAGIEAATASGAGQVIIVNSTDVHYDKWDFLKIRNFDEVPRHLFQ